MVTIGSMQFPLKIAEMMQFQAARDKNQPLADLIGNAIGTMGKTARNDIEKTMTGQVNEIGRLKEIVADFKENPQYHTAYSRATNWFNQGKSRFGFQLSPDQQKELTGFVQSRVGAINNFNQVLKERSGTAVSAQEFQRVEKELPNPGSGMVNGLFDGDDPVTFGAKADKALRLVMLGYARQNFLLKRDGFAGSADEAMRRMSLDDMGAIIQRRTNELKTQFEQQGAKPEALPGLIQRGLKQEFGI
jgi:hypothetical protein